MSELLPCKLCGIVPMHRADGLIAHGTWSSECQLWESAWMTPEQWTKLMSQGDVVITWSEGQKEILAVTRQDEDGKILSVIAEAPPQAQGDDVLRDAMRYRWLRHGDNDESCVKLSADYGSDPFAWLLRTEELDAAIDAAMK